jgi:mannose-6-phosphate isomerase-like protein (cupin superfamily)
MATILNLDDLPDGGDFEGYLHGEIPATFIWVHMKPGDGPRLHLHPYPEIFIVIEGEARYTVGDESIVARGGQMLIGPANVPHKFVNTGSGLLRQVDIHCHDRFVTTWLDDPSP